MKEDKEYRLQETAFTIGNFAVEAMLYEVACHPSPGLVSPVSNGAHKDMNYFTFIDSIVAISKYFSLFAQVGLLGGDDKEIFNEIRKIGIEAEKEMFRRTKGINTHKGMLFLLGVSCGAVGKVLREKEDFTNIPVVIKNMTAGIVQNELNILDLKTKVLTNGERLFMKYKTTGIRGEVEAGIPTVFDYGLGVYKDCADLPKNERLCHTLMAIMERCEDSTIIHRHSPSVLEEVQAKAKKIMELGGMKTSMGQGRIHQLCNEFVDRNISPGGSADLLGVTVFFHLVEDFMKEQDEKSGQSIKSI